MSQTSPIQLSDCGQPPSMRQPVAVQVARRLIEDAAFTANKAMPRWDDDRRARGYGTYASRRIDTATLGELRSVDTLPPESRPRQLAVRAAVQRLEQRLGRAPRAKEVADELGWTLAALHRCMLEAGAGGLRAGDAPLEDVGDAAAPHPGRQQASQLSPRRLLAVLSHAFEKLADREQVVMEMVYVRGLRFNDIGCMLGVSASQAARIHDGVVAKLLDSVVAGTTMSRVGPETLHGGWMMNTRPGA
jgi:RNA polymerase sigma factor for flagellar operon FliA